MYFYTFHHILLFTVLENSNHIYIRIINLKFINIKNK